MNIILDPNASVQSDRFLTPAASLLGRRDRFSSAPPSPPSAPKRRRLVSKLPSSLAMPELETDARRHSLQRPIELQSCKLPRLALRPRTSFVARLTSAPSSTSSISSCPDSPTAVYDFFFYPTLTMTDVTEEEAPLLEEPNKA